MNPTKEYLRGIFTWVIPEVIPDSEEPPVDPHFVWAVSPDGKRPAGTLVDTNALSKGKAVNGHIRVRGELHTVDKIKEWYGVEE